MKYASSLSRESIVDIEGKATERLEALYPTLKEQSLAVLQVPTIGLHCRNSEEYRFSTPAFIAGIPRNPNSHHWPSLSEF
ncbi:hypothetical protein IEQ34_009935 [Dendrobium chrysotoxum]|uniref:Uncharacterized protein n=1 Tax=Dendrobium chrysotoxum TaxID=161865 RepID=A0AAV7GKH4_DENCH|nr:hypothetical protein IEQ34_009935 [Dendrobium chrysotoxum]